MYRQLLTITSALAILAGSARAQQNSSNEWCEATTSKIAAFLPKPAPGLLSHEAWTPDQENKIEKTCGDAVQNWKYLKARAEQIWWFDDPGLAQQIAAAKKEQVDAQQQGQKDLQAHMADLQQLQKQYVELVQQSKMTEAQAVAEKIQKLSAAGDAKTSGLDDKIKNLQDRGRSLRIQIHANEALAEALYRTGPQRQPAGSIKGHAVYRALDKTLGANGAPEVFLAIYLGPEGFRNPAVHVSSVAAGPKCFSVLVELHSRADTLASDEAVARKMLEGLDYDALAKLLEP